MLPQEIRRIYTLLTMFLGESKRELDDSCQLQFACPRCVENKGEQERNKFNLEVNIAKNVFQCWSCSQHDEEMRGSIGKLIRMYGNETIYKDYKDAIESLRVSKYYEIQAHSGLTEEAKKTFSEIHLPTTYNALDKGKNYNKVEVKALQYLESRGIGWDIINKFNIGTSSYEKGNPQASYRIILPSYDSFGDLNYWTGRDIYGKTKQKYFNAQAERKDLIFNEQFIQWDADITLVEGPFDHIVVPNSIPLLGKVLNNEFKIYQELFNKANANINVFLDADAREDVKKIYKILDQGRLRGKIRYIPIEGDYDPSLINQEYGKKGIFKCLSQAKKFKEIELVC